MNSGLFVVAMTDTTMVGAATLVVDVPIGITPT